VRTKQVGSGVDIRDFVVIADGAVIGPGCVIHPHVVIEAGVQLGAEVEVFPGAVLGKEPKGAGVLSRTPTFDRHVTIGPGSSIGPHVIVFQDVDIGSGCLIGDGASIREKCRIGSDCLISRYVTLNYNVQVGCRTKVMDLTHLTGNMIVGDDVFISIHVSTTNDNALGASGYDPSRIIGPTIHDRAMIGAGASLLPKVSIGRSAVVASGAVVTADVPDGVLVAGIPARMVRTVSR